MTAALEQLGWRRILVEGDPVHRAALNESSPHAFSVNAVICQKGSTVHYTNDQTVYASGVLEFMSKPFIQSFHRNISEACKIAGDISTLDFTKVAHLLKEVPCIPLSTILEAAGVKHINFFILDVEVRPIVKVL